MTNMEIKYCGEEFFLDDIFNFHQIKLREDGFLDFSVGKEIKSLSQLLREKNIFDFDVLDKIRLNRDLSNEEIYRSVYCWLKNNILESQLKEGWSVLKKYDRTDLWLVQEELNELDFILMLSMAELYLKVYTTHDVHASACEMELARIIVKHSFITAEILVVCFDLLTVARKSLLQCIIKTKFENITEEEISQIIYAYELMTMNTKADAESLWTDIATKFGLKESPCISTFSYDLKTFISILDLSYILKCTSVKFKSYLWVIFLRRREKNCSPPSPFENVLMQQKHVLVVYLFIERRFDDSKLNLNYLETLILNKFCKLLLENNHESNTNHSLEKQKEFIRCCKFVVNSYQRNKNNCDELWMQKETSYLKGKQLQVELKKIKILFFVFSMLLMIMLCSSGQHKSVKLKKYLTLKYEYDKSVLYLLWCSGDIEKNPGPPLKTKQLNHDSEKVRHWILNIVPILLKLYWKHTGNSVPKNLWQQQPPEWPEAKPFYDTKNKTKDTTGRTITDTDLLECILQCCHKRQVQLPQQIQDEIAVWKNGNLQLLFKLYILRVELDKICSSVQEVICHAKDNDLQQKLTEKGISLNIHVRKLSAATQDTRNINVTREIAIILCKIVNEKDPTKKCEGIWDNPPDGWPSHTVLFDPNNRAKYKKKYPDKKLCSDKKIVETFLQIPIFGIKMAMEQYIMYKPLVDAYQALVRCSTAKEAKKCKENLHCLFHLHTNTMALDFSLTYLHEAGLFDQEVHAFLTHWWTCHKVDPSANDKLSNVQIQGERPNITIDVFQDSIRVSVCKQDVNTNVDVTIGYNIPFKNSKQISGFSMVCDVSQNQLQIQPSIGGTLSITSADQDSQPSISGTLSITSADQDSQPSIGGTLSITSADQDSQPSISGTLSITSADQDSQPSISGTLSITSADQDSQPSIGGTLSITSADQDSQPSISGTFSITSADQDSQPSIGGTLSITSADQDSQPSIGGTLSITSADQDSQPSISGTLSITSADQDSQPSIGGTLSITSADQDSQPSIGGTLSITSADQDSQPSIGGTLSITSADQDSQPSISGTFSITSADQDSQPSIGGTLSITSADQDSQPSISGTLSITSADQDSQPSIGGTLSITSADQDSQPSIGGTLSITSADQDSQPSIGGTLSITSADQDSQPSISGTLSITSADQDSQPSIGGTLSITSADQDSQPSIRGTFSITSADQDSQPSIGGTLSITSADQDSQPSIGGTLSITSADQDSQPSISGTLSITSADQDSQPSIRGTFSITSADQDSQPSIGGTLSITSADQDSQPSIRGTFSITSADQDSQPSIRGTLSITSSDPDSQPSSSKTKDAPISNSKNHPGSDILQTHTHLAPRILDNAITNLSSNESNLKSCIASSQSGTQSCFSTRIAQSHYQKDISQGITFNFDDLQNQPRTSKDVMIPPIPSNINDIKEGEHTGAAANIDNQSSISNGFCINPSYSIGQPKLKFVCDKLISTNHTTENATRYLDNCDQSRPSTNLQTTTDLNSSGNSGGNGSDRNPENGTTDDNVTVKKRKNSETEGSSDYHQKLQKIENSKTWDLVLSQLDIDMTQIDGSQSPISNDEDFTKDQTHKDNSEMNNSASENFLGLEDFLIDLINYESGKKSVIEKQLAEDVT